VLRIEECKCRAKEIEENPNTLFNKHLRAMHDGAKVQCSACDAAPLAKTVHVWCMCSTSVRFGVPKGHTGPGED